MKLVENWKEAWRWFSMWAFGYIAAVTAAIPVAWATLPNDVKAMIPDSWDSAIFVTVFVAAILGGTGRIIDQKKAAA